MATPSVMEYQALALYCIHRRLPVFDDVARKLRYVHKKVVHQTAGFSGCAPIPNPPMNYSVAPHEEKRLHGVSRFDVYIPLTGRCVVGFRCYISVGTPPRRCSKPRIRTA